MVFESDLIECMLALLLTVQLFSGAGEPPYRQPQVATDGRDVGIAFGAGNTVYFVKQVRDGFSTPVKVASATFLALGRHRGPRVVMTPDAIVISAIVGRKQPGAHKMAGHHDMAKHHETGSAGPRPAEGADQDGDLVSWRSTDGGKSWSSGVRVNDVPASAREGLHTMTYGGGTLFAAWLDLREKGTRIYGAVSKDRGQTWSPNRLVYTSPSGTVCQCCHPTAAIDSSGRIFVMFRNSLEGSRDMYVASSKDGETFAAAEKLGRGTWPLNACPMDGGGLAVDDRGNVLSIWRRDKEVFLAKPGSEEKLLGMGKDPTVLVTKKGTYALWTTGTALNALLPGKAEPVTLDSAGGFGQLTTLPDGSALAVWETPGKGIVSKRLE
jgi:hypothetical protein